MTKDLTPETILTFDQLHEWVGKLPFHQIDGAIGPVDVEGTFYDEFCAKGIARPDDVRQVESLVCREALFKLNQYLADKPFRGTIQWRVRPEINVIPFENIIEFRDDGPDKCPWTGRRCVMDKNWVAVGVYMRLSVSKAIAHAA